MTAFFFDPRLLRTATLVTALSVSLMGCSDDKDTDSAGGNADAGESAIGNPVGDPIDIDHETAAQTAEDNLIRHLDGLEDTLAFLEESSSLNNLVGMLFDDDDDDDHDDDDNDDDGDDDDDGIEIELSEVRDDLVSIVTDRLMVASTATVADDGLSVSYAVDAEFLCSEDSDEDESDEDLAEREADEADCADRLASNPLTLDVMSDAAGDVNVDVMVGETPVNAISLQLHDDQISARIDMENLGTLVGAFISPDDFEMPRAMEGTFAFEIRQDGDRAYSARFAVPEAIHATADDDQDTFALNIGQHSAPGQISFDGIAGVIAGQLAIDAMDAAIPWQIIVDMFYDDEGETEWVCETNEETGMEECEEVYIEPEEAPDVDEAFIMTLPGVTGVIDYTSSDDAFVLTNLGLGDETMTISVDDATIVRVDVNPDNGRRLDFTFDSPDGTDLGLAFSQDFAAQVEFAWNQVSDAITDLPDVLFGDTIGVEFAGAEAPQLRIYETESDEEGEVDTHVQMARGQLTLWADAMDEDVVITEGECFVSTECDDDDEDCDDEEDGHDLFGEIGGGTCDG